MLHAYLRDVVVDFVRAKRVEDPTKRCEKLLRLIGF